MNLVSQVSQRAALILPQLLCELRESGAVSNRIALCHLHTGEQYLQIQLVVTASRAELLDDDHVMTEEDDHERL